MPGRLKRFLPSFVAAAVLAALLVVASHLVLDRIGSDDSSDAATAPARTPTSPATTSSPSSLVVPTPTATDSPTAGESEQTTYDRAAIEELLSKVSVIATRPQVPGYERDCSPGAACSFGPAWTDDTGAPDSHNGCDTRNDVLGTTLQDVEFKPGTNDCKVVAGHFVDPYKGVEMDYATEGAQIHIDHLIPLAAAWDLGAADWSQAERDQFANDTRYELLAVNGGANESKGDSTPASWLPPNRPFRCEYVGRYLAASIAYKLPITRADKTVIGDAMKKC